MSNEALVAEAGTLCSSLLSSLPVGSGIVEDNSHSRNRRPFDAESYVARARQACFVCEVVRRNPEYPHHVLYEDEGAIAFLSRYPSVYGYTIIAPRDHREKVTGDFTSKEYLALQVVVHRVGEAVTDTVPTERLYVLSLGSQQGNRHVHWHVVPLPPGVPYEQQQLEALRLEVTGYLDLPNEELADLAKRIRMRLSEDVGT